MNEPSATSGEVESFTAAITELLWGSRWADIKALAQRTWNDCNRSALPWESVESHIENKWNELQASQIGTRRQDDEPEASLERHDLIFVLERIERGNGSTMDIVRVGHLGACFIDASEPPKLTEVGLDILRALQAARA